MSTWMVALVAALLLVPLGSWISASAPASIAASFVGGTLLHAQAPSATRDTATSDSIYEYGPRTRDGTGKYYMGREISLVMGHQGAGWLERPGREQEERTDLFIERIPVEPDDVVADIGAGTGYFAFPIAERVPEGRVLAVDIQPEMLSIIEERKRELGVENVETVRGTITDPGLPEGAVDVIYIVDAYHEFSHPREMGEAMFDALEPGGQLILLEYRAEDPTVPIKRLHKMTEEQARKEMAVLGFEWVRTEDYLPQQHVLIFEKP
ncbi:MAG: class I SAM-dependent methyltransferase [Longimicrobiales bacterium]|nr:class I SAM-dependent methyltransferase [Longimicrobiales bacterium]